MRVAIEELRSLPPAACHADGVPERKTALVVEHFLAWELRGKSSHGVAKFCFESRFFRERQAPPEVVRERGVFAVIDAHREIGPLSATFAVNVTLDRAARHGLLGIAANTSRAEAAVAGGTRHSGTVGGGCGRAGSTSRRWRGPPFRARSRSLRTLKSEVVLGVAERDLARLDGEHPDWRVSGTHAMIQVVT